MAMRTVGGGGEGPKRGRGAVTNPEGRFETEAREAVPDERSPDERDEAESAPETEVAVETARTIVSRNDSPDIPFTQSINPYRGCEHGCTYCYARPSHAWLGLSPGLDFETRLRAKTNAAQLLRQELAKPGYSCETIVLGANTDAYQPVERRLGITRRILEVLAEFDHPVSIITKSSLVERDLDLLAQMAAKNLCNVYVSVTTLDGALARTMEPRAATPARRLETLATVASAGVPCGVLVAPIIPVLTDHELDAILQAAALAGACRAGYVLLRLPHEVAPVFRAWLEHRFPLKAGHVMSVLRQMRGGHDYDATFGKRMRGEGVFAQLLARRFETAARRLGLDDDRPALDTTHFRRPHPGGQLSLF